MKQILTVLKGVLAATGGVFGFLFGPMDIMLTALCVLVATDYITGVAGAAIRGELSSKTGFKGLFKKLMIFALVAVANIADVIIPEANAAFRSMTIMFYATNEALSVIENAIGMGLDVPQKLKELFSHRDE